jgi:hypothetical protein
MEGLSHPPILDHVLTVLEVIHLLKGQHRYTSGGESITQFGIHYVLI